MADPAHTLPAWLRPCFLQRWLGLAIAARIAWQVTQPTPARYRFADSDPCWSKTAALPYDEKRLRALPEYDLLWLWEVDAERLLRMIQVAPGTIGEDRWTQAILGVCGHLTQGYHELKRRYGWRQARVLVRQMLALLVTWQAAEAEAGWSA